MSRRSVFLASLLACAAASAQYADYLSPGMQYESQALANASTLLSMARQNLALEMSMTGLNWALSEDARDRVASLRRAPRAGAAEGIEATDFRPARRESLLDQFAAFGADREEREFLRELGRGLFASLESDPSYRSDNLSHGLALLLELALATEKGRELDAGEKASLLAAVHRALLESGVMRRLSAEEITAAHDACVVLAATIATLNLDVRENRSPGSARKAREISRAALAAFGL